MRSTITTYSGTIPVFQIDDANRSVQGGFTLDTTNVSVGDIIGRGAVIQFDEATRTAKLVKTAKVVEAATGTATAYKVAKGSLFAVGGKFGGKVIASIDKSDANFDLVTVDATIGSAQKIGDTIVDEATTDYVALNEHELKVHEGENEVTLRISGTVYERRTYGIGPVLGAKMPRIIRSQSY
ncbi:hypothetical protein [Sphingobacterium faecium]|uniref:hypothetical protein n=1 Tax=Sphingobacterium faecium TaxID=34087 RepID=UPI0024797FFE|nr:hypothetical protein [Sphingobacterium faecium]WGQ15580.1 hypothetical protein QG727_04030 [Sphingobacterium faecium]